MANDDFCKALESADELQFAFTGSKSGKKFSIPIWFVLEGRRLLLLPVLGTRSKWYKGILKNPAVELEISGRRAAARATPLKDKPQVDMVMEKFRGKYGAGDVRKYYPGQDVAVEVLV